MLLFMYIILNTMSVYLDIIGYTVINYNTGIRSRKFMLVNYKHNHFTIQVIYINFIWKYYLRI